MKRLQIILAASLVLATGCDDPCLEKDAELQACEAEEKASDEAHRAADLENPRKDVIAALADANPWTRSSTQSAISPSSSTDAALAAPVAFFFLLSPAVGAVANARLLVLVSAALGAYVPLASADAYRQFGTEMSSLESVLALCPRTEQILTIRREGYVRPTPGYNTSVHRQLASWVQFVHGGGFNPEYFERRVPFPFATRKRLPAPHWRRQHKYKKYLKPELFGCATDTGNQKHVGFERFTLERKEGRFALYRAAAVR